MNREFNIKINRFINQYNDNINNIFNNNNSRRQIKDEKFNFIISNPILPENEEEIIRKNYSKTNYDKSNIRYHFKDLYLNRKIYTINYSFLPYENIDKSKSYDYNANLIYDSTGMLNITKLDNAYYNIDINTNDFNHIHLSMGHDKNYILLSLISIASILNTTNKDTFIHFHFVLIDAKFEDMKQIISLKKIYNNVEFIFYNGKQAEYDFSMFGNKEHRGVGDYTKFLIPEIVNNTNKIIILDSADIIAKKDLSEIYFFDLENNYFAFSLGMSAGLNDNIYIFSRNKFYFNIGVCLVNVRLFRKDNLYMAGYFTRQAYNYFPCPTQEMFLLISQYKFKYFPINYNCPEFYKDEIDFISKKYNSSQLKNYLQLQKNSPFRYTLKEIIEAESNQVVSHLFTSKPYQNNANKKNGKIWVNYSKMANIYEILKLKYPQAFKLYDK